MKLEGYCCEDCRERFYLESVRIGHVAPSKCPICNGWRLTRFDVVDIPDARGKAEVKHE